MEGGIPSPAPLPSAISASVYAIYATSYYPLYLRCLNETYPKSYTQRLRDYFCPNTSPKRVNMRDQTVIRETRKHRKKRKEKRKKRKKVIH